MSAISETLQPSAILFSANPNLVQFDDARHHLLDHEELYWEVKFTVEDRTWFSFPVQGLIHVSGRQVEYRVAIKDIIPFSPQHYEGPLAQRVKPKAWLEEWAENRNSFRSAGWRSALVITSFEEFSFDTRRLQKLDGQFVKQPNQTYIRVIAPSEPDIATPLQPPPALRQITGKERPISLAERNLEDFVVQCLAEVEAGLYLVERQLVTPAGRIDILCKDANDNWVVVELKRSRGTDQVVGQTLRYMGWVHDHYETRNVRGLIIVGILDEALKYALKAVDNIHAKVFKLSFE